MNEDDTPASCPHCGRRPPGAFVCGVEVQGAYDGVLFWACDDCGGAWHRWPEGHRLRERADPLVQTWQRVARA